MIFIIEFVFKRRLVRPIADPHEVYFKILPLLEIEDYQVIRRGMILRSSDYYYVRLVFVLLGDFFAVFKMLCQNENKFIVLEFSADTYLFFLKLFPILKRKVIMLNINHNLNSPREVKSLRVLSKYFKVVFIEPSRELLLKYNFIDPLYFKSICNVPSISKNIIIHVFTGWRKEQELVDFMKYKDVLDNSDREIRYYGRFSNRFLPSADYYKIFSPSSVIIILYDFTSYENRHSGVVLNAIATGTQCLLPFNYMSQHYSKKFKSITTFDNICDFNNKYAQIIY